MLKDIIVLSCEVYRNFYLHHFIALSKFKTHYFSCCGLNFPSFILMAFPVRKTIFYFPRKLYATVHTLNCCYFESDFFIKWIIEIILRISYFHCWMILPAITRETFWNEIYIIKCSGTIELLMANSKSNRIIQVFNFFFIKRIFN